MLKKILNLEGAQELSKNEQKVVKGGLRCSADGYCPRNTVCVGRDVASGNDGDCRPV
ncbi:MULTISPECIES: hypothetical protein [unclassified Flavobacterium]|jgi:hypothetical protein|uniref:hypothetical protein n=1 Tax=unclassified Flavobacterium TaxID=196869 RepID=UPI000A437C27|nr:MULTISPECIES: hypothetical protein [unclassified Flavobacterium]MEA9413915.1 hypothetical protein [Flavobacterium sp. PL02]